MSRYFYGVILKEASLKSRIIFLVFWKSRMIIMLFDNGQTDETMSIETNMIIFCDITDPGFK